MKDENKTKEQLIAELRDSRSRIAILQKAESEPDGENQDGSRFRLLYEQAPLPYQSLDENGDFIDVNKAWLDALGYGVEEVIGRNFAEFLHPDSVGHFKENFPRFKALGEVLGVEFHMLKKDGTSILVSFHGKIGRNAQGEFQQTHCIFQDITQRRLAQNALETAYSRHRSIIQTAIDGFYRTDLDGNLLEVNDTYCRMSGYSEQELLSMRLNDLEAMETGEETTAHIRKLIAFGEDRFQSRHKRKSGQVYDVEANVQYRPEDGGQLICFIRDVTERKRAMNDIIAQRKILKKIFESAPYIMMLIDKDYRVREINQKGAAFAGKPGDDIQGALCGEVLGCSNSIGDKGCGETSECGACPVRILVAATFDTARGLQDVECRLMVRTDSKDNRLDVLMSTALVGESGVDNVLLTINDITERKRVEAGLAESEIRLRSLLDGAADGFFLLDERRRFVDVNQEACRSLGYSRQELLGMTLEEVAPNVQTDEFETKVWEELERGRKLTIESVHRRKDGSMFPVEVSTIMLEAGGKKLIQGFARDITERKRIENALRESESSFRSIYDTIDVGVARVSLDFHIERFNPAFCRMLGYREEELIGRRFTEITHPEILAENLEKQAALVRGENDHYEMEKRYIHKDGSTVFAIMKASLVRDSAGAPAYTVGSALDITERKQAEEALRRSEWEKTLLNRISNVFLTASDRRLYEQVLDVVLDVFHCEYGLFGYIGEEEDLTIPTFSKGIWDKCRIEEKSLIFPRHTWEKSIWGKSLAEKRSFLSDGPFKTPKGHVSIRNFMAVPVIFNQNAIGVFSLANKDGGFSLEDQGVLEQIAAGISPILHVRLQRDRQELERRRVEKKLRESEERYRNISDSTSDFVFACIKTPGGDYELDYLAGGVERITGYSIQEVLNGRCWKFLVHSEDIAIFEKSVTGLEPGSSAECELRIVDKSGAVKWVRTASRVTPGNVSTESHRLFGSCKDITESKQAEEALQESERRYRIVADYTHDWEYWVQPDGSMAYVSPSCKRITGYSAEEFILDPFLLASIAHPDDRHWVSAHMREYPSSSSELQIKDFRIFTRDGEERWINHCCTQILSESGRYLGRRASNRDVTDSKKAMENLRLSEEKYRLAMNALSDGLWDYDCRTGEVYYSPGWCRMLGEESVPPVLDSWINRIHEEDKAEVHRSIQEHLEGKTRFWRHEHRILTHSGAYKWVLGRGGVVCRDAEGLPLRMVGTLVDIQNEKDFELERTRLQNQLAQAQKIESVGRLAGGVAHDFNNMLSVILGHTELAMDQLDQTQPLFEDLREIKKAADRSADLTKQLLAFARRQTISPKVLELNETVAGMLKMLRRLIGEDIELVWLPAENLWPVRVDPGQIDQVLANLCVNARDALSATGTITIETGMTFFHKDYCSQNAWSMPGEFVMLAVSDNGCGMDEETMSKIFEPFYTTKGVGEGTGLGLATVYGIVRQNNGFINVYSEPGEGTTFKIYFPRVEEQQEVKPHTHSNKNRRGKETVLLVEDEESILELGKTILQRHGYKVLATGDPVEALRMARNRQGPIHLLITDVVMPHMNGKDLRDKLSQLRPDLKTIFMSGYTANVIAHHGVLEENINFLQKPFSIQTLLQKVQEVLDGL